jgi:hypothetical protein
MEIATGRNMIRNEMKKIEFRFATMQSFIVMRIWQAVHIKMGSMVRIGTNS